MQSIRRGRLPHRINGLHSLTIALENDFKNAQESRWLLEAVVPRRHGERDLQSVQMSMTWPET